MRRRPPRSTHCISSAASDVYKRQQQLFKQDVLSKYYQEKFTQQVSRVISSGKYKDVKIKNSLKLNNKNLAGFMEQSIFTTSRTRQNSPQRYDYLQTEASATKPRRSIDYQTHLKTQHQYLSLIHISEPTRLGMISYAVFCLKKKTHSPHSHLLGLPIN
eukprot:TRINITY_DN31212_c0_g1_i2.p1 TRINITY_DN31212_c0_g1~~TRINITY_DN31212_c0_g1_i2.p1  ORF type:complete len:159 (-),score=20.56 TRINITY_DN31212_c0_g1_i2:52-528(-)